MTALSVLLGSALLTSSAIAVDLSDTVQLHGFASQAYISTSANRYFGPTDSGHGSLDFTELGLNLSWQALSNLQFAGQLGYRKAGQTEKAEPRLDYGLADLTVYDSLENRGGIRAGRYRMPFGLYNTTRDVANTRPSIFLPALYSDASRDLLLSLDGGLIYWESRTAIGDFSLSGGVGKLVLSSDQKKIAEARTSYVAQLLYELDGGRVRLAASGLDAGFDFKSLLVCLPGCVDIAGAQLEARIYVLSAQYNAENWSLTAEMTPHSNTTVSGVPLIPLPPPLPPLNLNSTMDPLKYYVQGTYRFAPRWEALLRYDVAYNDANDKSGAHSNPAYKAFAKDWTVGLSWEVRHDTKIRAEWHHVDGTAWLSSTENPNPLNTKENWDLFALQASYNF